MKCATYSTLTVAGKLNLSSSVLCQVRGRWQQVYSTIHAGRFHRLCKEALKFIYMIIEIPSMTRGLVLLFVIAIFTQCEKEEPSTEASIEATVALYTNAAMQGKLTIEQAYIHPLQIDFTAKRTDGNQFTFAYTNTSEDKKVRLVGSTTAETLFTIPAQQGRFDPIDVMITLQQDPYQLVVTPGIDGNPPTVDYAEFLANAKPSMSFAGKFNNRGQSTRVYIALNIADRIRTQATQLGKSPVALSKENRANFSFDPSVILQDLVTADLENAISFEYLGEQTVLIHQDFNSDLYEMIVDRLFDNQTEAVKINMIEINTRG
jgi:hypothetical protein